MIKPPFKLNGTVKATNFAQQSAVAAKRYAEMYEEAVKLGFKFVHDEMHVPPEDQQTPEQKAFLKKLMTP